MVKKVLSVTPWDVEGEIDYDKLVENFGVSVLNCSNLPDFFEKDVLYRRGIVFAHRDIKRVLDSITEKKPFAMMTGLMPTGKFHIGHMILAKQMILWQKLGAKIYIAVADVEAYNARGQSLEESRKIALEEYIPNYIALGLKPSKCEIYFQSDRSENGKKSCSYYSLQNLLARHITFNEFKAVYGEVTPGKMVSALLQGADMLHCQLDDFGGKDGKGIPVVVPVGIDQDAHIRLARDMSKRIKTQDFVQLSSTYHKFIPGLKGGKMSSSDETSFIALTDSPEEAEKKIKKYAFSGGGATLEEHKKKGGNTEIDVSFQYLKAFLEEDDKELEEIRLSYESGEMTTGELKEITCNKLKSFLKEHQEKLKEAKKKLKEFVD